MDVRKEVLEAGERILEHVRETPLEFSPYLGRSGNCHVYLKLENFQLTGSFKLRGAANKLLSLGGASRGRGVVTASTGNHGAAFAYLCNKLGISGTVYVPENTTPAKLETLRLYGGNIEFFGTDCVQTELYAREIAAESGREYISPYNDPRIIGGQGTIGIELAGQIGSFGQGDQGGDSGLTGKIDKSPERTGRFDAVLVPVGGGGLISGIAGYMKSIDGDVEIIGCQPLNSPVMAESVRLGRIVDLESKPTISDGTAGGIEPGALTFDMCRKYVDDFILVSEEEIMEAMKLVLEKHHLLIEGAAALPVASFLKNKKRFENKDVGLILSGSGIGFDRLKTILD